MISLLEARRIITAALSPLPTATSPLAEARGRVLAEAVLADAFYPSGDRSTMDGYVFRADAEPGEFRVVGEIPAGAVPGHVLQPGESLRIFTGALLPDNGGRVVPQEDAERVGDSVQVAKFPAQAFVRGKGSEANPGDVILPAGARLGPAELAMLAQIGAVAPQVIRPLIVRHIATGGEIVDPAETPAPGQIRDTNSALLAAQFAALGIADFRSQRAADDLDTLIEIGREPSDLLVLSGGASVGDYDFGAEALRRLGFTIHFDKINLRPGKPLTFATRGAQAAFVVPGNPVSHFVCFHVAIRLAVERLGGCAPAWNLVRLEVRGGETLRPNPRETWWPARAFVSEGRIVVAPKRWSTSGDTFSLAGTNALVRVPENSPVDGTAETLLLDVPAES